MSYWFCCETYLISARLRVVWIDLDRDRKALAAGLRSVRGSMSLAIWLSFLPPGVRVLLAPELVEHVEAADSQRRCAAAGKFGSSVVKLPRTMSVSMSSR